MATLQYNPTGKDCINFHMDNDSLVVLHRVIEERFREGEGFWFESDGHAVWLHPSIPVALNYDEDQPIRYSRETMANMIDMSRENLGVSFGPRASRSRFEVIDPEWKRPDAESESETESSDSTD